MHHLQYHNQNPLRKKKKANRLTENAYNEQSKIKMTICFLVCEYKKKLVSHF